MTEFPLSSVLLLGCLRSGLWLVSLCVFMYLWRIPFLQCRCLKSTCRSIILGKLSLNQSKNLCFLSEKTLCHLLEKGSSRTSLGFKTWSLSVLREHGFAFCFFFPLPCNSDLYQDLPLTFCDSVISSMYIHLVLQGVASSVTEGSSNL